jgi:DNA-directed RNA polymerase specialized sigma24 family protein
MCGHLVRQGTEPDDAEANVVAIAWEVVSGRRRRPQRPSPRRLADAVWNEVRRESGLRRRRQLELSPWPQYLDPQERQTDRLERWPGLLAAAVAAGVLTPRQVVVVAETRMEGRSMPEMAKRLGRPVGALYKERQRAEESLRAFALSYDWSSS